MAVEQPEVKHTEMTRFRPSRTSLSFLLSRSFLMWFRSMGLELVRMLRVAWAASSVSSLAAECQYDCYATAQGEAYPSP